MAEYQSVKVELRSGAEHVTRAEGRLRRFGPAERAGRVLLVLLAAIGAAALIIPIPIIHLVGIPLILFVGIAAAVRQGMAVARLAPMRIACPRCGETNSVGGGLGYRTTSEPIPRRCESCRRPLELLLSESRP